jgi:hypothetical protein
LLYTEDSSANYAKRAQITQSSKGDLETHNVAERVSINYNRAVSTP